MRHLLLSLLACLPLFGCVTESPPPVTLAATVDGWAVIRTDLEHAVILGEGSGFATVRSGLLPLWASDWFVQEGDYILIDGGESHHHPYKIPLPAKSRHMFTDEELRILEFQRGIKLQFEGEESSESSDPSSDSSNELSIRETRCRISS